jgi:hypothetical protein
MTVYLRLLALRLSPGSPRPGRAVFLLDTGLSGRQVEIPYDSLPDLLASVLAALRAVWRALGNRDEYRFLKACQDVWLDLGRADEMSVRASAGGVELRRRLLPGVFGPSSRGILPPLGPFPEGALGPGALEGVMSLAEGVSWLAGLLRPDPGLGPEGHLSRLSRWTSRG